MGAGAGMNRTVGRLADCLLRRYVRQALVRLFPPALTLTLTLAPTLILPLPQHPLPHGCPPGHFPISHFKLNLRTCAWLALADGMYRHRVVTLAVEACSPEASSETSWQ